MDHAHARRLVSATVVLAAVGCAATRPVTTLPPPTPGPARPMTDGLPGVDNFGVVATGVWRGAKPNRDGMASLAALHVGTIVDLQEWDESADVPAGIRYVHLPVSGWHADQVDVPAVLAAIRAGPGPVFIHCREGRDRTGLAIAAYRLSTGWSADYACAELRNFNVNPWWRGPIEARIRRLASDRPAPAP